MRIDKTTCWYDKKVCHEQMLLGARGELWPVLERSDHFPILKNLIDSTEKDCLTLLDVGCGAADLSRVLSEYFYTGADLENIIKNVDRKMHPNKSYVHFDIYDGPESCEFVSEYDIVVMNAFIDVLENPLRGLENILKNASKYVIIHRQEIDKGKTRVVKNPSYGGVTYHSIINEGDLDDILTKYKFDIVKKIDIFGNSVSMLLRSRK